MQNDSFEQNVRNICLKDPRYDGASYFFLRDALTHTVTMLNKPTEEVPERHVTAGELLEGIRSYAVREFGQMAMRVLHSWGISSTEDFGEIVFNLIDAGKLRRTDRDKKEDFADGYDFRSVFVEPFLPKNPAAPVAEQAPARLSAAKKAGPRRKPRTKKKE